jgi:hypothetical protein
MSSQRLHGGPVTLFLLLSCCRLCCAIAPIPPPAAASPTPQPSPSPGSNPIFYSPQNPATGVDQFGTNGPALRALPVNPSSLGIDASTTRKFYTLTASLREIYDDNVNTSNTNQKASFETDFTPSVLVDFPGPDGDFSARYTFGLTYYTVGPDNTGNGGSSNVGTSNSAEFEMTHELLGQYAHSFSDRFQLSLAEDLRYFTEPGILESTGTNYQNGPYVSNNLNGTLTAQWSPLISSSLTYANSVIQYQDTSVGNDQNSVENTGSISVGYALLPKITTSAGVLLDNITYDTADRGYTTYTVFFGPAWQALPSLSLSARGGATYIEPSEGQASIAPYGALTVAWTLGARSTLSFNYAHEVTPSDEVGADGQLSDRFSASFAYQVTPRLSSHLTGVFTSSTISNGLSTSQQSSLNNYQEDVYEVDAGLTYQYNSYLGLDFGAILSGVSSNISNNNYSRDETYVGIRGTY